MHCDLVLIATNIMVEITKIIGIKEGEYTTVLNAEDTTILSGIQYDKRVIGKDEEVKVLRKINSIGGYMKYKIIFAGLIVIIVLDILGKMF